jgi:hypothetical protein
MIEPAGTTSSRDAAKKPPPTPIPPVETAAVRTGRPPDPIV